MTNPTESPPKRYNGIEQDDDGIYVLHEDWLKTEKELAEALREIDRLSNAYQQWLCDRIDVLQVAKQEIDRLNDEVREAENNVWEQVITSIKRAWPNQDNVHYMECLTELITDLINERDELKAKLAQTEKSHAYVEARLEDWMRGHARQQRELEILRDKLAQVEKGLAVAILMSDYGDRFLQDNHSHIKTPPAFVVWARKKLGHSYDPCACYPITEAICVLKLGDQNHE